MPAIKKPNLHFDATLWTGNGGTQSITNSGFQPDFVWYKGRSTTYNNATFDSTRGVLKSLYTNTTAAEGTSLGTLTAFNSNGFSVGDDAGVNTNAGTYVGWQWKAGGSTTVTNNDGTITSQVSANPTAGFSVVTFTAPGSGNFSAGHGLGVTPGMVITKVRGRATSWITWHNRLNSGSPGTTYYVELNTTGGTSNFASVWGSTGVTSSVIGMGVGASCAASDTIVAYCFAAVDGYSKFGSYTGNGSTDGPFVYLGFRPRFIMFKKTSSSDPWEIIDTARNLSNVNNNGLLPNSSDAEITNRGGDILSNGFKLRYANGTTNESSATYIYAAFAEAPFKYANAR